MMIHISFSVQISLKFTDKKIPTPHNKVNTLRILQPTN